MNFITVNIVIIIYSLYNWISKNKITYLQIFLLFNAIIFTILILLLIVNGVDEDIMKSGRFSSILLSIILLFKSKHELRGYKIIDLINKYDIWDKKHIYFFPKDFNDIEIDIIEKEFQDYFYYFTDYNYENKLGELYIWIKKKNNKINIKIVNQFDHYSEIVTEDIVDRYKHIEKLKNGKLKCLSKKYIKVELNLEINL